MCCLFGLIDCRDRLTRREKTTMMHALAESGEERGTDATGIAYVGQHGISIYKQPKPAHRVPLRVPSYARSVIGHTRMATQGTAKLPCNNHPFAGTAGQDHFALAHNGVIWNDRILRRELKLPDTKVETDSYIAVQLLEQQKALNFDSLRTMVEALRGSYSFTILDDLERVWFVRGNNPLCLYKYTDLGFCLYASTQPILESAAGKLGLQKAARKEIPLKEGEILMMTPDGGMAREAFCVTGGYDDFRPYGWDRFEMTDYDEEYRRYLEFGRRYGVSELEMEMLLDMGMDGLELEMAIYDEEYRHSCLEEYWGYCEETEAYHAGIDDPARAEA